MSAIHCDVKIGQKPIVYSIYPAVYRQILSLGPGFLDYVAAGDIGDLLNHIELTEAVKLLLVIEVFKLLMVQAVDIPEMPQPVVDKPESVGTHGGPDAAAAVVAHHHDMFHLEDIDRILQNRQTVEICVDHHVGDIAMYKYFSRHQIYDLVGGYPAVGTTYPEIFGVLLFGQLLEKLWVFCAYSGCPAAVVFKKRFQYFHSGSQNSLWEHHSVRFISGSVSENKAALVYPSRPDFSDAFQETSAGLG